MRPITSTALTTIDLPLERVASGKVREMFELDDQLLLVATDRLSAFDIVFERGIPDKGQVLTRISDYWFDRLQAAAPHHRLTTDVDRFIALSPTLESYRQELEGRAMLCKRAEPLPVECVVRGYIEGSGWKEYQANGTVTGIELPQGLERGSRLPEPIFTPATKATSGHDENISFDTMTSIVGGAVAEELRTRSLALYREGLEHALGRGLILADTKFEFGWCRNNAGERELTLIDEVLTPDSSRYWDAEAWSPGGPQPSFDKQPVRDFLEAERAAGRWSGEAPLPPLPDEAVEATSARYREAFERVTASSLS